MFRAHWKKLIVIGSKYFHQADCAPTLDRDECTSSKQPHPFFLSSKKKMAMNKIEIPMLLCLRIYSLSFVPFIKDYPASSV